MERQLDVLFVHTNASKKIYQDLSESHSAIEPPIWAALLANHVRSRGFGAAILDCEAERYTEKESVDSIVDIGAKLVCFVVYGQQPSASTQNMSGAISACKLLKEVGPAIKTLFVGGHVAALPRESLTDEASIDMICLNEGAYTISNLLNVQDLNDVNELKKVNGLGFRGSDGEIILNTPQIVIPKSQLVQDLPGMAWDLLPDINKYRTAGWHSWSNDSEKQPFGALYTSLGCPYKCSFCMINIIARNDNSPDITSQDSNSFRWWPADYIIKEFDQMASMGIKNVKIADELFVLNPRHFLAICDLLIERDYGFNIWCYARIDTCKPKYLDKMKKAGINWVGLGIENPSTELRKEVHKDSYEHVNILDVIKSVQNAGINVGGNYIFGLPMDTMESMEFTFNFSMENKTEMVNYYCAMAYPGSPLHLLARKNNIELPKTYEGYSQHSFSTHNLSNDRLSSQAILKFRDQAWTDYHKDETYLKLLENKFGIKARIDVEETSKITLERELLN